LKIVGSKVICAVLNTIAKSHTQKALNQIYAYSDFDKATHKKLEKFYNVVERCGQFK
jgi:hypothetical protein